MLLILLRTQFESPSKFLTYFLVGEFPKGNAEVLLTAGFKSYGYCFKLL